MGPRRAAARRGRVRRLDPAAARERGSGGGGGATAGAGGLEGEGQARGAVAPPPLGVLKGGTVAADPPLPEAKREAIRAIAFGDAMVLLLRLRGSDLAARLGDFGLLWGGGSTSFHRPYVGMRHAPDILDGFLVGREARRRAALPDEDLRDLALEDLRAIVPPSVHVGRVDGFACSRWPVHPFVRGGYSFLPPGGTLQHRRDLAAAVDGVLFFAGEATHTHGEPATVHGAIETGYRAASEVIESLRRP